MASILDEIVKRKYREVSAARQAAPLEDLQRQLATAPPVRDFLAALQNSSRPRVIAEFKRASPSAGAIRPGADPVATALAYERRGAACVSVLTDGPAFQGSLDDLRRVRAVVGLPTLRKDFIVDRYQIVEARLAGADAVLLIAEMLNDDQLHALQRDVETLGMTPLVECHDPDNLRRVVESGARLIGVNNRDLRTFTVSLEHGLRLARLVPPGRCLVSESGIRDHGDVMQLVRGGYQAILVGESLMRAPDPGAALAALLGN
jgi:indole-3-glycerol phosphate synthase